MSPIAAELAWTIALMAAMFLIGWIARSLH